MDRRAPEPTPVEFGPVPQPRTVIRPLAESLQPTGYPADEGPRSYRRPDHFILDDVAKALAWDPAVDSRALNLKVTNGVLSISGTVSSSHACRRVEVILARIFGLRSVTFDVAVAPRRFVPRQSSESHQEGRDS